MHYGEHWKIGPSPPSSASTRDRPRRHQARARSRPPRRVPALRPRPLSALHPRHPGPVPPPAGHPHPRAPAARNRPHRLPPGRHPPRRVRPSRLGRLRQGPHRARRAHRLRIRHGPRAPAPPSTPRPDPRELPPGARRSPSGPSAAPARTLVYDNLRSADRCGNAVQFHPRLSNSPGTTTSPSAPAPRGAATRRARSSAGSNTCAAPSLPARPFRPRRPQPPVPAPARRNRPAGAGTPTCPTAPSPTPGQKRSPGSATSTSRPTTSDAAARTTLEKDLRRLGLHRTADELDDRIAEAARKRWKPAALLEPRERLGRFKPLDWDWNWPDACDRDALERILALDYLAQGENIVLVGA